MILGQTPAIYSVCTCVFVRTHLYTWMQRDNMEYSFFPRNITMADNRAKTGHQPGVRGQTHVKSTECHVIIRLSFQL